MGGYGTDNGTGLAGKAHVVGVGGFRNDDFVTGIQADHESHLYGLTATAGHDDVVNTQLDIIAIVVTHQFLQIAGITLRGAVFQHLAVHMLQGLQTFLGSMQVGLTDVQVIHFDTTLLGVGGKRSQLTDGRSRHLHAAF